MVIDGEDVNFKGDIFSCVEFVVLVVRCVDFGENYIGYGIVFLNKSEVMF